MATTVRKVLNVVATAIPAEHLIRVTWTYGTGGVTPTEARIMRSLTATGAYSLVGTVPYSTATWGDSTGTPGTRYYYKVFAYSSVGNKLSSASNYSSAVFPPAGSVDTTPPSKPATPTGSLVTANSFTATTTGSTDAVGVTSYEWYLDGAFAGSKPGPGASSWAFTNLTQGTTYSVTVLAKDLAGNVSVFSDALSQATLTSLPAVPTAISTSNITATNVDVSYAAGLGGSLILEYRLYQATSSGGSFSLAATNTTVTPFHVTLGGNTKRYWHVKAWDGTNESAASNEVFATTLPTVPTGLTAAGVSATEIDGSFTASPDPNIASYDIAINGVVPGALSAIVITTFAATGLTSGTTYSFQVRSRTTLGVTSAWSSTIQASTTTAATTIWPGYNPPGLPALPYTVGDGCTTVGGSGRTGSVLGGNNSSGVAPSIYLINSLTGNTGLTNVASGVWRGGLYAALTATSGPKTILFEVGGISDTHALGDKLMFQPKVSIYGHTAPGTGYFQRGAALWINASDTVMEGLHIFSGDELPVVSNRGALKCSHASQIITNILIDRNSFYWGPDETVDTGYNVDALTVSNNIIAEGLWKSVIQPEVGSGYGHIFYGYLTGRGKTILGNLYTQNYARNPLNYCPYARIDNNLVNNWGAVPMHLGDNYTSFPVYYAALRNNVIIKGNYTPKLHSKWLTIWSTYPTDACFATPGQPGVDIKVYLSGNALTTTYNAAPTALANQWDIDWDNTNRESGFRTNTNPLNDIGITLLPTASVPEAVCTTAGAFANNRDAKDAATVYNVRNNLGNLQSSVAAYGGWPTPATATFNHLTNGMPTGATAAAMNTTHPLYGGRGYTNLEVYCFGFRDSNAKY